MESGEAVWSLSQLPDPGLADALALVRVRGLVQQQLVFCDVAEPNPNGLCCHTPTYGDDEQLRLPSL